MSQQKTMADEGNDAVLLEAESVDISSDFLEHSYVFITNPISFEPATYGKGLLLCNNLNKASFHSHNFFPLHLKCLK